MDNQVLVKTVKLSNKFNSKVQHLPLEINKHQSLNSVVDTYTHLLYTSVNRSVGPYLKSVCQDIRAITSS